MAGKIRPQIKKSRYILPRSTFMVAVCMICLIAIVVRLFYLQVVSYDKYYAVTSANTRSTVTVTPERGSIYDANGTKLATNYTVYRVFISPKEILEAQEEYQEALAAGTSAENMPPDVDPSELAQRLSEIIDVDYATIYATINEYADKYDRTLKRNIGEEEAEKIRQLVEEYEYDRLINLESSYKRYYPYSTLACHVLGFTGTDGGLTGIELQYDDYLSGSSGKYITSRDARSNTLDSKYETSIELQDGNDVYLTIDATLQNILETQLKTTFEESDPLNRVTGIAMNVKTGAIYAMATYPDFDCNDPYTLDEYYQALFDAEGLSESSDDYLNTFYTYLNQMWRNKAVSDTYEPGSTFKPITYSAAVEENLVDWDEEMNCTGVLYIGSIGVHCHRTYGHGVQSYARALQQSCNPACMTVAARLGRQTWYNYFLAFGYAEKTAIDLPGETKSIYTDYESFTDLNLANYSFGQSFKISPIQHITGLSAVANGGYLLEPYVVSKIVDGNGNIVYSHDTVIRRQVISEETSRQMMEVLEEGVSTDGGAKNAYVAGYKIAAKTGTSEVLDILNEEGEAYLRVGSTVGIAPSDDPQIAVLIIVDQPQCENVFGSYVAAPYIANFLSEALPYLGVERNLTEEEEANLSVTLRNYIGLSVTDVTADLSNRGIKYELFGNGEKLTAQIPSGGSTFDKSSGTVYLYCDEDTKFSTVTVPSVIGYSATQAKNTLVAAGLNVVLEGATNLEAGEGAIVVSQSPEADTDVTFGTVITVVMRHVGATDD